tara:strand:+ start:616 stop:858 length:243 start_codon:yes stop_codon:yes gene_type:complete
LKYNESLVTKANLTKNSPYIYNRTDISVLISIINKKRKTKYSKKKKREITKNSIRMGAGVFITYAPPRKSPMGLGITLTL